jgi:hypothetical protein
MGCGHIGGKNEGKEGTVVGDDEDEGGLASLGTVIMISFKSCIGVHILYYGHGLLSIRTACCNSERPFCRPRLMRGRPA